MADQFNKAAWRRRHGVYASIDGNNNVPGPIFSEFLGGPLPVLQAQYAAINHVGRGAAVPAAGGAPALPAIAAGDLPPITVKITLKKRTFFERKCSRAGTVNPARMGAPLRLCVSRDILETLEEMARNYATLGGLQLLGRFTDAPDRRAQLFVGEIFPQGPIICWGNFPPEVMNLYLFQVFPCRSRAAVAPWRS